MPEVEVRLAHTAAVPNTVTVSLGGGVEMLLTMKSGSLGMDIDGDFFQYVSFRSYTPGWTLVVQSFGGDTLSMRPRDPDGNGASGNWNFQDTPCTLQDVVDLWNSNDLLDPNTNPFDIATADVAPGSDGSDPVDPSAIPGNTESFAGGAEPVITATAADVLAAIEAATDEEVGTLITVALAPGSDGSGLVGGGMDLVNQTNYHLAGGLDGGDVVSTRQDVYAALMASAEAQALIIIEDPPGDGDTVMMEANVNLNGGSDDREITWNLNLD